MAANDDCLSEEMLESYVDDGLTDWEKVAVEEHVGGCDDCAVRLRQLYRLETLWESTAAMAPMAAPMEKPAIWATLRYAAGAARGWIPGQNSPFAPVDSPIRVLTGWEPLRGAAKGGEDLPTFGGETAETLAVATGPGGCRLELGRRGLDLFLVLSGWPSDQALPRVALTERTISDWEESSDGRFVARVRDGAVSDAGELVIEILPPD